jgi:glutaredoxin
MKKPAETTKAAAISQPHFFDTPWYAMGSPIEGKTEGQIYMNENAVRARAGMLNVVAWCAMVILWTTKNSQFLMYTLAPVVLFDFTTAAIFGLTPFSPFGILATLLTWGQPPLWKPARQKRFAWTLGILMVSSCIIFGSYRMKTVVKFFVGTCIVLTWLEGNMGFCMGCWFYNTVVVKYFGGHECQECKLDFSQLPPPKSSQKVHDAAAMLEPKAKVQELINANAVMLFTKTHCPHCQKAKALLDSLGCPYNKLELDTCADPAGYATALIAFTGLKTVPNIFIGGVSIGGNDALQALHSQAKLLPMLNKSGVVLTKDVEVGQF